jgi:hypothetical protein
MLNNIAAITSRIASFDPNSISGLKFWYDASDTTTITVSSGRASAITNKATGISFTLSQGTAGKQPLIVAAAQNGLQILRFTTARVDQLNNTGASAMDGATVLTIFWAGKTNSTTNGYKFAFGNDNGTAAFPLLYQLSNKNYFETGSGTNSITGTSSYNGTSNIQYVEAQGTPGNTQKTVTGTTETNTAAGSAINVGSAGGIKNTAIGSSSAACTDLDFYEVFTFNRALTSTEYDNMISYLKTKWGI